MPVITGSATSGNLTYDNKWYFRVVATNKFQGEYLAHYIKNTLKKQSVSKKGKELSKNKFPILNVRIEVYVP